jgi:hypothetical protein
MADPTTAESTDPRDPRAVATIPVATLRHWAEVAEFAIENPAESTDALLELAEALGEAVAAT